ncbi:hypothetical protein ACP4OV_006773 [Aristida adscensionis]
MGEDRLEVEKGPHGFCFKWMTNQGETRTLMNHCYTVVEAGFQESSNFFWQVLLKERS